MSLPRRGRPTPTPPGAPAGASHDLGAYDYDQGAGAAAGPGPPLSWRNDPETSLSDWTIEVTTEGEEPAVGSVGSKRPRASATEYHVHRAFLVAGQGKSDYFASLFGKGNFSESEDRTSRLTLKPSEVAAFPALLDFVYTGKLDAAAETATALRHLAGYLRMGALYEAVISFIGRNLQPSTAFVYLSEANVYSDEKIIAAAMKTIGSSGPAILLAAETFSPEDFKAIVSDATCGSEELSNAVLAFCQKRSGTIDSELLEFLTHDSRMPRVSRKAALPLLELSLERLAGQPAVALAERCLEGAAGNWVTMLLEDPPVDGAAAAAGGAAVEEVRQAIAGLPFDLERALLRRAVVKERTEKQAHATQVSGQAARDKQNLGQNVKAHVATIRQGLERTGTKAALQDGQRIARLGFDRLWRELYGSEPRGW